jgi:uncharacterized damage-inducible protein DinB
VIRKKEIADLYDYNWWANLRTLEAASRLTADQLNRNLSTSHGSVHGTLCHTLAAEWIWAMRCNGTSPSALLEPGAYPGIESLRAKWLEVEQSQKSLIEGLTDEALETVITYTNTRGEVWRYSLGTILQHVVNHSTYHRGQVTTLLRQLGAQPAETDLLVYVDSMSDR